MFKASEFARRAGVTVRALHHYDRLGLLPPARRTESGYRLYGEPELARLAQIATLKFVGLPLERIKALLDGGALDLAATLRLQRAALGEQRRRLDLALEAIGRTEAALAADGRLDWDTFKEIVEVTRMASDWSFTRDYYSPEARQKIDARNRANPDLARQGERDWADLIAEVEAAAAAGEDPTGPHGRALAARWSALIEAFTGGDASVREGLNKLWADQANWPAQVKKPYSDAADAFIKQAQAAAG